MARFRLVRPVFGQRLPPHPGLAPALARGPVFRDYVLMSMKRTKQVTRGKGRDADNDSPFNKKPPEKNYTFAEDVAGQPDSAFVAYNLKAKFGKGTLIEHPKFGRGVVIAVEESRVEVLFQDGNKKLGHAG
jgi:hypothetical protein